MEDQFAGSCWKCANEGIEVDTSVLEYYENVDDVYLSTTPFVPGHAVVESRGIVSGEAIIGTSVFSDMLAGMADFVGGRAGSYENKLRYTRQVAMTQMALEAKAEGANAVVGVSLSYETIRGSMLMVAAYGTAVVAVAED
jgi:uncharacterized protein YbjQ (UPF0145 family)